MDVLLQSLIMWSNKGYAARPMGTDGVLYSLCTFGWLRCRGCGRVWAWRPASERGLWGIWLARDLSEAVMMRAVPNGFMFRAAQVQCVVPECMDAEPEFMGEAVLMQDGRWLRMKGDGGRLWG